MKYQIRFTKEAEKDFKKLTPKTKKKLRAILESIVADTPEKGKKLQGDLKGFYSIRLTYKDRIVYNIDENLMKVFLHCVRTHYAE